MNAILDALVGDPQRALYAAVKILALFLTAVMAFRLGGRRSLAEFSPVDFVTAISVGAIIGRTATATDASAMTGAAALVTLLFVHRVVVCLRLFPGVAHLVDPTPRVLVHDGVVRRLELRRCRMTGRDLDGVLRRHGVTDLANVHLAVFEPGGSISVITRTGHQAARREHSPTEPNGPAVGEETDPDP
ncbi:DUF421 domain-containing protein [Sphaerisporangium sp. NPDC049003]|uniref:DUF421 domain-containing protein n=1 Tax=Sphaerisporangium sp. NPDC049003 TaxID=3364517 RepID=UPI003714D31D